MRRTWRSWAITILACSWTGVLALAAWEPQVRPAGLDRICAGAQGLLAHIGVQPGLAVFSAPRTLQGNVQIGTRAHRLRVVGRYRDGTMAPIRCWSFDAPPTGLRVAIPLEESMLYALMIRFSAFGQNGRTSPHARQLADLTARAVGRHFQCRELLAGRRLKSMVLVWTVDEVELSGSRGVTVNHLLLKWELGHPTKVSVEWDPLPAAVNLALKDGR